MSADIIPHPALGRRLRGARVLDLASGVDGTVSHLTCGDRVVIHCADGVARTPRLGRVMLDPATVAGAPTAAPAAPPTTGDAA